MHMNETALGHQIGIAAGVVWLLEFLKRSNWFPWLNQNSALVNRIVSIAVALIAAIGVTMNITGNLQLGGSITIAFPSLSAMLDAGSHFLAQLALQEGFYQQIVKRSSPSSVPEVPPKA
jgi:hypothetical protein